MVGALRREPDGKRETGSDGVADLAAILIIVPVFGSGEQDHDTGPLMVVHFTLARLDSDLKDANLIVLPKHPRRTKGEVNE